MSYSTPEHRRAKVSEVREIILSSRRAVITTHANVDGDAVGSEAALASWMRANGSEVAIVNPTPVPKRYKWMLDEPANLLRADSTMAKDRCSASDLAIVVDASDISRIGSVWSLVRGLRTVVIDHHIPGARRIGGTHLSDTGASAAGELVYDLMLNAEGPWTKSALVGLYVAISTDTGSFRFDNTSPAAHRIAADLVERGVRPGDVSRRLHHASSLRRFALLREALGTLRSEDGITWMVVPSDAYRELGAVPADLEGMVDVPRSVAGTDVAILFRSTRKEEVKVSFRSHGDAVDVAALAAKFGGGGHRKASGALLRLTLPAAIEAVLEAARTAVGGGGGTGR